MPGASSSAHQRRRSADRIDGKAVRWRGPGPPPWFAETDWSAATGRGAGTAGASAASSDIALSDVGLSDIALLSLAPAGATPPEDGPSGVLSDPDGAAPARAIPANGPSATDPDCPASADAIPEGSLPAGTISPGTANFPGRILSIFAATTPPAPAIQTAQ
jgi:hypothetical protein